MTGTPQESDNDKWWSFILTFGKIPRDEMGLIHIVEERKKCNLINFSIHPASPLCSLVSLFLLVTCISCSITAYEISFSSPKESIYIQCARYIVEVFFILRILGNFHLAYYDPETTILIVKVKMISLR